MDKRLQQLRKNAGYKSARIFAEKIGLNLSTYTSYEQGLASIPIDKAWLIADELNCSVDDLIGRTPIAELNTDLQTNTMLQLFSQLSSRDQKLVLELTKLMISNKVENTGIINSSQVVVGDNNTVGNNNSNNDYVDNRRSTTINNYYQNNNSDH